MSIKTIEQQAKSYTLAVFGELDEFSDDITQAYIDGAKWIQEKAREWLEDRFYNSGMHLLTNADGGYREAYDIRCDFESIQEMVNDFYKAMEE